MVFLNTGRENSEKPSGPDKRRYGGARPLMVVLGFAGLALVAALIHRAWGSLVVLFYAAGWGLAWVVPLRFLAAGIDARGWLSLFPDAAESPSWSVLTILAVIRDGINNLLPVVRVGGEIVAVRLLGQGGTPMPMAAASIVVEISVSLILQLLMTLAGLLLLLSRVGDGPVVASMLGATLVAATTVTLFLVVQMRIGLVAAVKRLVARWTSRAMMARWGSFEQLDQDVLAIYEKRQNLWRCAGWQVLAFCGGMIEMWWVLRLVGVSIGVEALFIMESLMQAIQSASFMVPAAVGVQEGGFILLGSVLGLGTDVSLMLALVRRARQVATGLPALLLWRWRESQATDMPQLSLAAEPDRRL